MKRSPGTCHAVISGPDGDHHCSGPKGAPHEHYCGCGPEPLDIVAEREKAEAEQRTRLA
jgi:hypothetical protein